MRFLVVALMIALLPLRGWAGEVMATEMASSQITHHHEQLDDAIELIADLAAINVVAERNAIDAGRHEFAVNAGGHAGAVGRVLRVGDDEVQAFVAAQRGKIFGDDLSPRFPTMSPISKMRMFDP